MYFVYDVSIDQNHGNHKSCYITTATLDISKAVCNLDKHILTFDFDKDAIIYPDNAKSTPLEHVTFWTTREKNVTHDENSNKVVTYAFDSAMIRVKSRFGDVVTASYNVDNPNNPDEINKLFALAEEWHDRKYGKQRTFVYDS